MSPVRVSRSHRLQRSLLATALVLAGTGIAWAQSTTGNIFGTAPAAAGETVRIRNTASGLVRDVPVDAQGRFTASALPIGSYTVSLMRDGQVLDARKDVDLRVGTSTQVSFAAAAASTANAQNLAAVTVSANALPAIDVTSVDSRTVVTATQLAKLPLARNAEAVAMLAPGVVSGSPAFGSAVSFSGSSVSENAYYINGFDTSNPLTNIGGMQLPYDAIEQQEVLSGGYGAQYGRSDGGVISQVGKRGTNEWHFGAHVQWTPRSLRAGTANTYYASGAKKDQLYGRYAHNGSWDTDVSGYLGGPLVRDKLFLYAAYEVERQQGSSVGSIDSPYKTQYKYHDPRWYAKLDWNIDDNNILELTAASSTTSYEANQYDYDYAADTEGAFHAQSAPTRDSSKMGVLKYTGYLTDNLTLTALYGKMHQLNYTAYPGYDASKTYISSITAENPAIVGGNPVKGLQPFGYINAADAGNRTTNLRVDLSYHLGDHTLSAGIDNQVARAIDQGSTTSGPGYWWIYHNASNDPDAPIDPSNGVPAPSGYPGGETGYYVSQYSYSAMASARTVQRAQYVEDAWQVDDRLLLKLGLRNDTFTNYNVNSEAYVRQTKPQWAPRLGFAWDVNGDASFKVFGNAGRYYLALPNQVAIRAAGGSLYVNHYYTYTGINPADGTPTGLTELPPYHPVSPDGELGEAPDPTTVASKHLKSEYQDEFILGFQKQLGPAWVYGVKGMVRRLRSAIDDVCDTDVILANAAKQGVDVDDLAPLKGCRIFNPGVANDYVLLTKEGTHETVHISNADYGFPKLKRNYYSLEFKLEHPFDGKWYGSFSYLYSRSYGNTEGQVRTDVSQSDISATTSWDNPAIMVYSNGDQASDRRHQFKFDGYYQLADEWQLGANVLIASGAPKSCLGSFGFDDSNPDPQSYGYSAYYFCNHQPEPPGRAGRLPWQWQLSANVEYRPAWADKKLAFDLYVFNLLNQQRPTLLSYGWGSTGPVPTDSYDRVIYRQAPRYVRLGISYDF
jgi:outer membrane receptor for ferrienterochelin and colicin